MRKIILLCLLISCLAPFIVISIFNFPSIDDFWNADKIIDYGRTGSAVYFYEHVSGRYFSLFLMGLLNGLPSGSFVIFQVWPILIFGLLLVAMRFLFRQIFINRLTNAQLWIVAIAWLLCCIVSSRSLFNVWYWVSSSICYQLAIIFTIFFSGIGIRWLRNQSTSDAVLVTLLLALIPGCSEILVPLTTLTTVSFVYVAKQRKLQLAFPIIWLMIHLIAVYFSISSAGAQVRAVTGSNAGLSFAFLQSFKSVGYYAILWLINPVNLIALVLAVFYLPVEKFRLLSGKQLFLILLSILLLGLLIYLPVYWSGLKFPPPRITNVYFFIFSLGVIFIAVVSSTKLFIIKQKISSLRSNNYLTVVCWSVFILSVFLSANFQDVMGELYSGKAASYHQHSKERFKYIQQQNNKDTIEVTPLPSWSFVLTGAATEAQSTDIFTHYKTFFDKKEIIFQGN